VVYDHERRAVLGSHGLQLFQRHKIGGRWLRLFREPAQDNSGLREVKRGKHPQT
jgi:hypothetical protein